MLFNISVARSKGFKLVDENTLERSDATVIYSMRNKNPYKVISRTSDKRGNVVKTVVKHCATFTAAMRAIL